MTEYAEFIKVPLTFEGMNQAYNDGFTNYLIQKHNSLNNTIGKHIKTLKSFLNYCINNDFMNAKINLRHFKVLREEVDIVYLTELELFKIMNLEGLPKHLEYVQANFCFACFTGLRFSDIVKLREANIKGQYVEIKTEKTRDMLKIPINFYAEKLLLKYKGKFNERPLPPTLSLQKQMNI